MSDVILSMNRVAFTVFGKDIYWYSLIIVSSIIVAFILGCIRGKKRGYKDDIFIDLCIIILIAGVIGARILFVLSNWSSFENDLVSVFYIWEGGLAILGGFITVIPCYVFYCYKKHLNLWELLDIVVPCFALAQCIGRWGNFVNQELYGPAVSDPALQFFPVSVLIDKTGSWHLATFFYESVWSFATFIVLSVLWHKKHRNGDITLLYIVLYSVIRIILDAVKLDGTLQNQLICVGMIIIVGVIFFFKQKMYKDTAFSAKLRQKISPRLLSDFVSEFDSPKKKKDIDNNEQ